MLRPTLLEDFHRNALRLPTNENAYRFLFFEVSLVSWVNKRFRHNGFRQMANVVDLNDEQVYMNIFEQSKVV